MYRYCLKMSQNHNFPKRYDVCILSIHTFINLRKIIDVTETHYFLQCWIPILNSRLRFQMMSKDRRVRVSVWSLRLACSFCFKLVVNSFFLATVIIDLR